MINFLWLPITFQDTALLTIAVPATTARLAPANHVFVLSILASMTALATMLVPPVSGWLSDARRRRGGSRSSFVFAGLAIDVAALVGITDGNQRVLLHRGRAQLRQLLSAEMRAE